MAGDWIKMRVGLVTHPKVMALSEALSYDAAYQEWSGLAGFVPAIGGSQEDFQDGVDEALRVTRYVTVTALLRFWGYANEHAKDDFIQTLRVNDVDEIVGIPGFGCALEVVGWAKYDPQRRGVILPNFAEHNAPASDRGGAERQKRYRDRKKAATTNSDVTRNVTKLHREEKRREESKPPNPVVGGFDVFWGEYPKKVGKGAAESAWKKASINGELSAVLTALDVQKRSEQWQKDSGQYIPNPATWINQKRWLDGDTAPADQFKGVL